MVTVTHWPGPIVPTAWLGKTGVVALEDAAGGVTIAPGEPISPAAFLNAPLVPTTLSVEIVGGGSLRVPPMPGGVVEA